MVRGRNYYTNIVKKKGPAEARKAQIARKHLAKIVLAVREFGPDEETNPGLARIIRAAMKDNMPRSTVDKRIQSFVQDKETLEEISIGGYGAGGTALIVQCVTDNSARCRVAIREAFKEVGGTVGNDGCVDHLFTKRGAIRFKDVSEEQVVEASMEAEVEDCITEEDGSVLVTTLPENFRSAQEVFDKQELEPAEADVEFAPLTLAELKEEHAYELKRLLYLLEECDDVNDIFYTASIPEDLELKFNTYGTPFSYAKAQKEK